MIRSIFFSSILGFIDGVAYGAICNYLPFVIVNLGALLGAAFVLAILVYNVSHWAKVRSTSGFVTCGIVAALAAIYALWGTAMMFDMEGFDLNAFNPLWLIEYASLLYQGGFNIEGDEGDTLITGTSLLLLWAAEAGVFLFGVPWLVNATSSKAEPFCENCGTWNEVELGFMRLEMPENPHEFVSGILSEVANKISIEASPFWDLPFGDFDEDPHIRLDLSGCKTCMQGHSASATIVHFQFENETLFEWTSISQTTARRLRERKPDYDEFAEEIDDEEEEVEGEIEA